MGIKKSFCLFFILLIASCSNDGIMEKMEQIKTVGNHDPETALTMLDSLELDVRDKGEYVRNKYDLLRIRLNDKADHMPSADMLTLRKRVPFPRSKRSITMPAARIAICRTRPAPWRTSSSRSTLPSSTRKNATPSCSATHIPISTTYIIKYKTIRML